jgi:hypothetical protein
MPTRLATSRAATSAYWHNIKLAMERTKEKPRRAAAHAGRETGLRVYPNEEGSERAARPRLGFYDLHRGGGIGQRV